MPSSEVVRGGWVKGREKGSDSSSSRETLKNWGEALRGGSDIGANIWVRGSGQPWERTKERESAEAPEKQQPREAGRKVRIATSDSKDLGQYV